MPMRSLTKCGVPKCQESVSDYANLCDRHRTPGAIVEIGQSTMVITIWVAEHEGELALSFSTTMPSAICLVDKPDSKLSWPNKASQK